MSTSELKLLQTAIMQAWNSVVITDADPTSGYAVQIANPAFCEMTGYSFEELHGRSLKMLQGPETDPVVISHLRECLAQRRYFEGSTVNYRKDRTPYHVRWNISPVFNEGGDLTHFVSVQQDISAFVASQQRTRLLAKALDATHDPVFITNKDLEIVFVNRAFTDVSGYSAEELIGNSPRLLRSGHQDESFFEDLRESLKHGKPFRSTFVNRKRDGSIYYAEQSISSIEDDLGRITHYVSVSKDISEQVRREQSLRQAASTDKLTGVFNRFHGEKALKKAHIAALEFQQPVSLILGDIDFFKKINDQFGHAAGDRILVSVAKTLEKTVRNKDTVIRWGGEEFLIVLADCAQAPAVALAERIRERIEQQQDGEVGRVTMSFGVAALSPGETIHGLIERADQGLYRAKQGGRNRVCIAAE